MKRLKEEFKIIKLNFKTIVIFEIIFKLLTTIIFLPLAVEGFSLAMKITGYNYLTIENIFGFILSPITLILIFIILIFLTFITLFDFSTILIIYDASYNKIKIGVIDSVANSFSKCKKLIKFKNILLVFFLIFLIPLLNVGISSNVITTIKIPEFIMDFITSNALLSCAITVAYILLVMLLMKWIYTIHYMILEGKDFFEAVKCSSLLSKKNRIKDLLRIILFQIAFYIICIIFIFAGILIIYLLDKVLVKIQIIESLFITVVWVFMVLVISICALISNSISYLVVTGFYYNHKREKNEKTNENNYIVRKNIKSKKTKLKILTICVSIIIIIFGYIFTYQVITGKTNLNIEYNKKMELTAHRGASVQRPENTMSSFVLAEKLGADYIELDVQQTKDGKVVVSHDTNLYRVAGVNKNIIDLTYDEILTYEVGSFFDEAYRGEKMPLLTEVMQFAKSKNVKLNIEIKPTGKEKDFEKQVVDIVNEYNFAKRCVVTSQKYDVLEKIKNYDKNIKTIYVMSVAIGDIASLEYADGFSLEASNVNEYIVSNVHNSGREVYAWTVNTEESINYMIDMNVDNIITDDIPLGKELIIKSKQSNLVDEFIKIISNL